MVVSGEYSEGLRTTAFPAVSAGASFITVTSSGKFHGVMQATTPAIIFRSFLAGEVPIENRGADFTCSCSKTSENL